VEAAGVEPASENVTSQETTCLFRFMPQSLGLATQPGTFAADAQNGQETQAASLKVSSSSPDVAGKTSPLYDVLTAAHGRSRGGRQLKLIKLRMPVFGWQLSFCTRLRVCAPRHASWPQASPSKPWRPLVGWPNSKSYFQS